MQFAVTNYFTLQHQPAHMSSYRPIGCPSPISPKYMAGPMSSLSNARFIPHIGNSVLLGMVRTASTYLYKSNINNNDIRNKNLVNGVYATMH